MVLGNPKRVKEIPRWFKGSKKAYKDSKCNQWDLNVVHRGPRGEQGVLSRPKGVKRGSGRSKGVEGCALVLKEV